jgi:spermidine synthase
MPIETVFNLCPEHYRDYQITEADAGALTVHEHDGYRWLCSGDAAIQSIMRLDAPEKLILPNHLAMLMGLPVSTSSAPVLNLGTGTGAIERFLNSRLPALELVSVDSNPSMIYLARDYFYLPRDWPVQLQTAEDYLQHSQQIFSLVLADLFAGGNHAPCLFDADFYRLVAQHLTEAGVLSLNLCPRTEAEIVSILVALRQSLPWVMLVKVPDHGNIVLLAGRQQSPSDTELAQRASQLSHSLQLDFDTLLNQIERLPPPAA